MRRVLVLVVLTLFVMGGYAQQDNSLKIKELEMKKKAAVAKKDYVLAGQLKKQIDALKSSSTSTTATKASTNNDSKIAALEAKKQEAVKNGDYKLAGQLKKQIANLKNPNSTSAKNADKIEMLEKKKSEAVANKDYALAGQLKKKIEALKNPKKATGTNADKIEMLERQKETAVANKDYQKAKHLKEQIEILKNPTAAKKVVKSGSNLRETALLNMSKQDFATTNISHVASASAAHAEINVKLKKAEGNQNKDLKYRRSSLYTMMIHDAGRKHANVIKDAFGNEDIPGKFDNHNIGPYVIDARGGVKDQSRIITSYLNANNVAKSIISKWFNRDANGNFNMELIAARGMYDASEMDKQLANSTERGESSLADAGIELLGKTFVVVNDFKFTNKEDIAKTGSKILKGIGTLSKYAGYDVSAVTTTLAVGATIAGKGYIIKSTSYLYRLVWNEETEAIFYQSHWSDANNPDPAKVEAFNSATNYKLQFIGSQSAHADVQSSIFTNKSEHDLIRMATVKSQDKAIAKLQKKFEEFKTKTPLISVDPLKARIGVKEGVEKNSRFEVMEQILGDDGKTTYKRVGMVRVNPRYPIWDNSYTPEEYEALKQAGKLPANEYTVFKGVGNFYPGMLIKQIN